MDMMIGKWIVCFMLLCDDGFLKDVLRLVFDVYRV